MGLLYIDDLQEAGKALFYPNLQNQYGQYYLLA
jgi:hypothetical protein